MVGCSAGFDDVVEAAGCVDFGADVVGSACFVVVGAAGCDVVAAAACVVFAACVVVGSESFDADD